MSKGRERLSQVMADFMEIPRDLVLDMPKLTLTGQEELYLENHKGIIEYSQHKLKVNLNRGFLEIYGDTLEIAALRSDEMIVVGRITGIQFID